MTKTEERRMAHFRRELRGYEKETPMTDDERAALREWVAQGRSVHDNPFYGAHGGGQPLDFLDCYRHMMEEQEAFDRMTEREKANFIARETGGYTEDTLREDLEEASLRLEACLEVLAEHGLDGEAAGRIEEIRRRRAAGPTCCGDGETLPFQ